MGAACLIINIKERQIKIRMFAKVDTFGLIGLSAFSVRVESSTEKGTPDFRITGLGDASIQESRQRVLAAMENSGFSADKLRAVVNLYPADIKKSGSSYDLPILISVLAALGDISGAGEEDIFIGELSLSGDLAGTAGVLPMVAAAKEKGYKRVFLPYVNVKEASLVRGIEIYGIKNIRELADFLGGRINLTPAEPYVPKAEDYLETADFSDVKGQENIKTAVQTAAAGFHNMLMIGPPGSGKSMIAKRIAGVLPAMSFEESIETTSIYSVAGLLDSRAPFITRRPFRPVSHTASGAGIVGGGKIPSPGEISLANNGVMFLDELPEFRRDVLETLRQPLEDKKVVITRATGKTSYPCKTMLVAAMNPCPCGNFGSANPCGCTEAAIAKYLGKISRPVLDRIDIQIEVSAVNYDQLRESKGALSSAEIRRNIEKAREIQKERFKGTGIFFNSDIPPAMLTEFCPLDEQAERFLRGIFDTLGLSARAYDRILKVARTAADIEGCQVIGKRHISRAVQYRTLDRKYWK